MRNWTRNSDLTCEQLILFIYIYFCKLLLWFYDEFHTNVYRFTDNFCQQQNEEMGKKLYGVFHRIESGEMISKKMWFPICWQTSIPEYLMRLDVRLAKYAMANLLRPPHSKPFHFHSHSIIDIFELYQIILHTPKKIQSHFANDEMENVFRMGLPKLMAHCFPFEKRANPNFGIVKRATPRCKYSTNNIRMFYKLQKWVLTILETI